MSRLVFTNQAVGVPPSAFLDRFTWDLAPTEFSTNTNASVRCEAGDGGTVGARAAFAKSCG
jgi:hypothetical protein